MLHAPGTNALKKCFKNNLAILGENLHKGRTMNWLLIAGGTFLGALAAPQEIPMQNFTLRSETILAKDVVCRNMWGTPMPPNGVGGYSLTAPVNPQLVAQSLIQPPRTSGPVFRPVTVSLQITDVPPTP